MLLRRQSRGHMARKIIEDGLPAVALLFLRMRFFAVEGDGNRNTAGALAEFDNAHAVTEGVLNQLLFDNSGVLACKVESERTIFGFHSRRELAAGTQIDSRRRRMPVWRSSVPDHDVRRRGVGPPNVMQGCGNDGGNDDLHRGNSWVRGARNS